MDIGSNKHDLVGKLLIILRASSSLTCSRALKVGGAKVGASVAESKVGNASCMLLIYPRKIKET